MAEALEACFCEKRILVIGDLMLDRYLWGDVSRISPEAPVPVVKVIRETERGGGAANVALNLAGLGIQTEIIGFIGTDTAGERLTALLQQVPVAVKTERLVRLASHPTITKTRVIGDHQQMLRLDWEIASHALSETEQKRLLDSIESSLQNAPDGIILSDYGKGVLEASLCRKIIHQSKRLGIPVFVDPKGRDYTKYTGATAISPNRRELADAVQKSIDPLDLNSIAKQGAALKKNLGLEFLAITLSEQGIALIDCQEEMRQVPATAREVFDVSGAGDTVIATLAAGIVAELSRWDAVYLANLAAGVVVGRVGTTPIDQKTLMHALSIEEACVQSEKWCTLEMAVHRVARWRQRDERIVFTNGCFDLLHAGHVTYLEQARRLGERLVVGLNSDRSVRHLKGPSRPLIHQQDRARVLSALASVDLVIIFDEETPLRIIQHIRPDVLAKGADYTEETVVGALDVKSWGGEVALVPLMDGRSSSKIIQSIQRK